MARDTGGVLHTLEERLEDAKRDLARADATEAARIEDEIGQLGQQITEQRRIIADPRCAEHRTDKSSSPQIERSAKKSRSSRIRRSASSTRRRWWRRRGSRIATSKPR